MEVVSHASCHADDGLILAEVAFDYLCLAKALWLLEFKAHFDVASGADCSLLRSRLRKKPVRTGVQVR